MGQPERIQTILYYKGVFELAVLLSNNVFRYHAGKKPIYSTECIKTGVGYPQETRHSVLAVGYGVDPATDTPYVIIQNSMGQDWGDNGFGKISLLLDPATPDGICGILSEEYAFFVDIEKPNTLNTDL